MKAIKKIIVLLLMGAMSSTSISGCSMAELIPEMNVAFLMQPLHLSRTSDLCVSEDHIMTSIGENILDTAHNNEESFIEASEAAISSENNSENISCVTSIQPESEQELTQRLVAEWVSEDEINTEPKTFSVKFNTYPSDTMNKSIIIESADPNAVYFPYDENADRIIEPMLKPMDNALPAIAVEADEDGAFEVSLIGTAEGDFPLTARNVLGDEIGKFSISLIPGYIGVAMDNQTVQDEKVVHEHVFQDQVIPATFQEQGVTQHSCNICGYTFRDCYTAKVECSHEPIVPESAIMGGVRVKKMASDIENTTMQGSSLAGCEFTIYNSNEKPVVVSGVEAAPGEAALVIVTDENGYAATGDSVLPYGQYRIRETKAPAGYQINREWFYDFTVLEDGVVLDAGVCTDSPVRGGISVQKKDAIMGTDFPYGDASFEGIVFQIINASGYSVNVNGSLFLPGDVVMSITTDENGIATTGKDCLPAGLYTVKEASTPVQSGYALNTDYEETVQVKNCSGIK